MAAFSKESLENSENGAALFQCWKKKQNYQPRILHPPKLSFQTETEIRYRLMNKLETIFPVQKIIHYPTVCSSAWVEEIPDRNYKKERRALDRENM